MLTRRARDAAHRGRWTWVAVSLGLHLAIAAALLVAPVLAERDRLEIETTYQVRIVPLQALGQPDPAPTRPRAPEPAPPKPKPEPEPEATPPKPAPRPEPEAERPAPEPRRDPGRAEDAAGDEPEGPRQRQGSIFGSATGTSTFGGAVAGVDNPDFVYNYYIDQMLSMISAHWVRPPVERGVEAVVHFRIDRRGQVSDLELVRSSGLTSFDLAGLRAVRQAAPLPPLPASYPRDSVGVNLIIR